jgi:hypothetical protein
MRQVDRDAKRKQSNEMKKRRREGCGYKLKNR